MSTASEEPTEFDFPSLMDQSNRLATFAGWPETSKKTPGQLSHAGFFYNGRGERVTCFACGVDKSKKWRLKADPWAEHAILNSKCDFLKMVKGSAFIDAAWDEEHERNSKKAESRKKAEKRKAERAEMKLKAERDEKEMKVAREENKMQENVNSFDQQPLQ